MGEGINKMAGTAGLLLLANQVVKSNSRKPTALEMRQEQKGKCTTLQLESISRHHQPG